MSININQVDKSEQTGKQTSEISGDGKTGVATQLIAPHGMAYRPKAGSLAISLAVGGDPSNTASIAPQGDIALDLAEGEAAFGNFAAGCYMVFRNSGIIELIGDVQQQGKITNDETVSGGISLTKHTHGGDSGGQTTKPN